MKNRLRSASRLALTGAGKFRLVSNGQLPSATSLTVNDVADLTVLQRVGTSKTVTFSGTYNGPAQLIQARVVDFDTGIAATPWTTIAANPSGGTYSGSLSVPQGGFYRREVRDGNDPTITAQGANRFGVGAIIGEIGQSNMANFPSGVFKYPLGDKRAVERVGGVLRRIGNTNDAFPPNTLFGAGGYGAYTASGNNGDGYVFFANLVAQGLGVPVLIINKAVGGSNIDSWQTGQANWNAFAAEVAAVGGDCEMVLWHQGESDAAAMAGATYGTKMGNVHTQCKTLTGRDNNGFKFGVVSLGPGSFSGSIEGDFGKIRAAQVAYATGTPGAFLATSAYDTATADGVHISGEGFNRLGRRYAKSALAALGVGSSGAGPRITSASRSGNIVTVNISHASGTALTDGDGGTGNALTGFQVWDNGTPVTISATAIVGNTVRLTLATTPSGSVTMAHAMMNNPSGANAQTFTPGGTVYDNATYYNSVIGCPLQPCAAIAVA